MEGLVDAAVAQARGQTDVIAYVGGQPSLAQLATLKQNGIRSATICPDPDAGGDAGIISFLTNLDPDIRGYVAERLPHNADPDEYIIAHGIEAWRALIDRADRGAIYRAKAILGKHDLATPRGRDDALDQLMTHAETLERRDVDEIVDLAAEPSRRRSRRRPGRTARLTSRPSRPRTSAGWPSGTPGSAATPARPGGPWTAGPASRRTRTGWRWSARPPTTWTTAAS